MLEDLNCERCLKTFTLDFDATCHVVFVVSLDFSKYQKYPGWTLVIPEVGRLQHFTWDKLIFLGILSLMVGQPNRVPCDLCWSFTTSIYYHYCYCCNQLTSPQHGIWRWSSSSAGAETKGCNTIYLWQDTFDTYRFITSSTWLRKSPGFVLFKSSNHLEDLTIPQRMVIVGSNWKHETHQTVELGNLWVELMMLATWIRVFIHGWWFGVFSGPWTFAKTKGLIWVCWHHGKGAPNKHHESSGVFSAPKKCPQVTKATCRREQWA